jgi:hypothetical protein
MKKSTVEHQSLAFVEKYIVLKGTKEYAIKEVIKDISQCLQLLDANVGQVSNLISNFQKKKFVFDGSGSFLLIYLYLYFF